MPDIQETANLVQQATNQILGYEDHELINHDSTIIEKPLQQSIEQRYLDVMKRLQFGKLYLSLRQNFLFKLFLTIY